MQQKLLVVCIYWLPHQNLDYFLSSIKGLLDHGLQHLEDFVILGNSNEYQINTKNGIIFKPTKLKKS